MHRVLRLLLPVVAVALTFTVPAHAATLAIDDIFDPTDVLFSKHSQGACIGNTASDLVVAATTGGCATLQFSYALSTDLLTAATLDLYLRDDTDPGHNPESVRITLDGTIAGQYSVALSPFHFDVLAFLSPDGLLNILLDRGAHGRGQSDFYFERSVLHAEWSDAAPNQDTGPDRNEDDTDTDTETTTPVPEPASLLLIGAGLAAAMRQRRVRR